MTNYDHYARARFIANQLEAQGKVQLAKQVRAAIDEGVSGTEIFMQLRFYLSPLQDDVSINPIIRDQIVVLVGKINEVLTS